MECSYGSFQRSFHLPSTVDENQVDASYQNGVLSLKIPKKSTSEKIEIKVN
jgi:HSP20 family protein